MSTNYETINVTKPESETETTSKNNTNKVQENSINMDENNKKAFEIMKNEGSQKAVEFMFKHPTEKNDYGEPRKMSYSEMRSFYG